MDPFQSNIKCALHPKDYILRVDTEFLSDKELYCVECLLQLDNAVGLIDHCRPLDEFIDKAAKFYEENRTKTQEDNPWPEDYANALKGQEEIVETVRKHVEEEKKKVQAKFDEITKATLKALNTKRDEYFALLDQQVFNLKYGYIFLEKQLKKAFPRAEDSGLYPSKDELFTRLGNLKDSSELLAFVKNIKEDLNEKQILPTEEGTLTEEEARRFLIKKLITKLEEFKTKLPTIMDTQTEEEKRDKIKQESDKALEKYVDSFFELDNSIEDLSGGDNFPKSGIIKPGDFQLLRKWLDKDFKNRKFKLIFKGTKDGMNATKFHELCNNKGPTVCLMKSGHGKIFGGFMPEAWTSRNNYVNNRKIWLFSITNKAKYELQNPDSQSQYAGYDYYTYGPTFGGGHDLYVSSDFTSNSNYSSKSSYSFSDNTSFTGGYNFTLTELEVFSLDK